MAITPKPFAASEKIRRRVFYPKPNLYADVDINQETEAILTGVEAIADKVGAVTTGLTVTQNTLTLTKVITGGYTLNYSITLSTSSAAKCLAKTVEFEIPTPTTVAATGGGITSIGAPPTVSVYLVAKRKTVTFVQDQVMSGVNIGAGNQLASETIVWYAERVAKSENGAAFLNAGEEVVAKLFSIGYEDVIYTGNTADYLPYILMDSPQLSAQTNNARYLMGTDSVNNLYESIARAWLKIKEIKNKVDNMYARLVSAESSINLLNIFKTYHGNTYVTAIGSINTVTISGSYVALIPDTTSMEFNLSSSPSYTVVSFGTVAPKGVIHYMYFKTVCPKGLAYRYVCI